MQPTSTCQERVVPGESGTQLTGQHTHRGVDISSYHQYDCSMSAGAGNSYLSCSYAW